MADSLSLIWSHSTTPRPNFTQFRPNFIQGILIMGQYRVLLFGDMPRIKKDGILKFY